MDAGVKDLWVVNVGTKMPYIVWHAMFEGSVVPRTAIQVDIGKVHYREGAKSVPVIRTEGDGRLKTRTGVRPDLERTVTRTTYPLFCRHEGTINYHFTVGDRKTRTTYAPGASDSESEGTL